MKRVKGFFFKETLQIINKYKQTTIINLLFMITHIPYTHEAKKKLEDLKVLGRSPDLLNNV